MWTTLLFTTVEAATPQSAQRLLDEGRYSEARAEIDEMMRDGPTITRLRELREMARIADFGAAQVDDGVELLRAFIARYEDGSDVVRARHLWCERMDATAREALPSADIAVAEVYLADGNACAQMPAFKEAYIQSRTARLKEESDGEGLVALGERFPQIPSARVAWEQGVELLKSNVDDRDPTVLVEFAQRFPGTKSADDALSTADALFYAKVSQRRDAAGYADYLQSFPNGTRRAEATAAHRRLLDGTFRDDAGVWTPTEPREGERLWVRSAQGVASVAIEGRAVTGAAVAWTGSLTALARVAQRPDDAFDALALRTTGDPSGGVGVDVPCLGRRPSWVDRTVLVGRDRAGAITVEHTITPNDACTAGLDAIIRDAAWGALHAVSPSFPSSVGAPPAVSFAAGGVRPTATHPPGSPTCPLQLEGPAGAVIEGQDFDLWSLHGRVGTVRAVRRVPFVAPGTGCAGPGYAGQFELVPSPPEGAMGDFLWALPSGVRPLAPATDHARAAAVARWPDARAAEESARTAAGHPSGRVSWLDVDGDGLAEVLVRDAAGSAVVSVRAPDVVRARPLPGDVVMWHGSGPNGGGGIAVIHDPGREALFATLPNGLPWFTMTLRQP